MCTPASSGFCMCQSASFGLFTMRRNNTENSKQMFPGKELRGYSTNPYIHVPVSDLHIPLIGLPILLQEK
jgi:hypothetical protein